MICKELVDFVHARSLCFFHSCNVALHDLVNVVAHYRPSLSVHYSKVKPLNIVYGRGQFLYDEKNQPYLDCINNVTQGTIMHTFMCIKVRHRFTRTLASRTLPSSCDPSFLLSSCHFGQHSIFQPQEPQEIHRAPSLPLSNKTRLCSLH